MFAGNEDEDLFNPSAGSNLASLFGTAMAFKNENANLSYTAPKQPKSETQEGIAKPSTQSAVICSKFINAFKQIDGEYISQGKCGIAIIGSHTLNTYELIIYKSKQDIISRSKLRKNLIFKIQNNFISFIDDQQHQWSVHFEENELENFVFELQSHNVQISRVNENKLIVESRQENDSDSSTTKASILSRMAKMGQPILPTTPKTIDSESDDTDKIFKKTKKKPKHVNATGDQPTNLEMSNPEYVLVSNRTLTSLPQTSIQNFSPINQFMQTPDMFNIFLAESRTHNCEMRMNMSQLSSKLDKVIDEMSKNKLVNDESKSSVEMLNKIEQYENLIKANVEDLKNLQHERMHFKETIANLELKITELESANKDLNISQATVKEQKETIEKLEQKVVEQETQINTLTNKYENNTLAEDNIDLKGKLEEYTKKHELFSKKLKLNMNMLYKSLMDSFKDDSTSFQAVQIQHILALHLRTATLNVIQEFSNNFDLKGSD